MKDRVDAPLARLRVVMERPHERFDKYAEAAFLRDLSQIAGCPEEEIRNLSIRHGCVKFEASLDEEAVKRLLELYDRLQTADDDPELRALREFLTTHNVTSIVAEYDVKLQIVKRTPTHKHIVFVHGWTGDSDSFGDLPQYLSDSMRCTSSIYQYPTSWWSHSPSIIFVARNLHNWLRNNVTADRLAFVAHSFGGLVVRKFLVLEGFRANGLDNLVRQITFVASPHDGAALAEIAQHVPLLRSAQLTELSPSSGVLFELNELWQTWVQRMMPKVCRIRSIFGTADRLVTATSARGLDTEAVPILGANHTDIVTPRDPDDEVVQTIVRFLRESAFVGE